MQKELKSFPDGHIVCCHSQGKYHKWYQQEKGHKTYISKKNKSLAVKLAEKKLIMLELEYLINEQKALNQYLRFHKKNESDKLLSRPGYKELLEQHFKPTSQDFVKWANETYPTNTKYADSLRYNASNGKKVRSKSEVIIDQALFYNKIPFRYEAELKVGFSTYYPDFTILHPTTGEMFLWEHFGLMNDPEYASKALKKINAYISIGIIPGKNLIMTFETDFQPLDLRLVESYINYYFL